MSVSYRCFHGEISFFGGGVGEGVGKSILASRQEKASLDFLSNQSFSVHAWPLNKAICLILWLKFPLGLPLM